MNNVIRFFIVLVILGATWRVHSHNIDCSNPEAKPTTLRECAQNLAQNLLNSGLSPSEFAALQTKGSMDNLVSKISGVGGAGVGLANTTRNFLSHLDFVPFITNTGDNGQSGELLVNFNQALGKNNEDNNFQFQALLNTDPSLSGSITNAIPAADRASLSQQLQDQINGGDDITLSLSYNYTSKRFGRNISQYNDKDSLFRKLSHQVFMGSQLSEDSLNEMLIPVLKEIQEMEHAPDGVTAGSDLSVFGPDEPRIKRRIAEVVQSHDLALQSLSERARSNYLDRYADLVNNQPQLHFTVMQNLRDDLVGPDALSAKVTYEMGFANLNAFNAFEDNPENKCKEKESDSEKRKNEQKLKCYRNFMENAHRKRQLINNDRLSFSLEYTDIDSHNLAIGPAAISFAQPDSQKLTGSMAWSRTLNPSITGNREAKLEIELDYEEFLEDTAGNDRFVATATLISKVGGAEVPFSIQYANKSEFLDDDAEQLSAHVAIKFSWNPANP